MSKKVLIVWGGWDGHTPKESADVFAPLLEQAGHDVTVADSMAPYEDESLMGSLDLIVPIWTMGEISKEQWKGLNQAVYKGCGLAGFHGGLIDAFRNNTDYQWMTGAQWVAHPGNCDPTYTVKITELDHPITRGISDFDLPNTEQYYCHFDPAIDVLCTTTFTGEHGDTKKYRPGATLPYAWTKTWGDGRVFGACWGHTFKDFEVPEAKEIVLRGMDWAMR
jgi:hypothetical protein